jgi:hypothetical protein
MTRIMTMLGQRLRAAGHIALIGAAGAALTLAAAPPALAASAPAANHCLVQHDLYQQPVAAVIAYVEGPENEGCHVGNISLDVYRNGVLVADISGGSSLNFRYDCVTTAPTVWWTNWDGARTLNCG